MLVEWLEDALADLEDAYSYIAQDDPAAAARMVQQIVDRAETLASMPALGRKGRVLGTRELVISPFVLAYHVTDRVEVLRVLHGARRWPDRF